MKQSAEHTGPKTNGTAPLVGSAVQGRAFFQAKLAINQPNDVYEQEADAMADRVMRMTVPRSAELSFFSPRASLVQRKYPPRPKIQRKCAECEKEEGDAGFEQYVSGLGGQGAPLSAEERNFFEPRFNYDFSNVRIHTDWEAAQSAQHISALAFTTGDHIVFNSGQYQPHADHGQRLMAHELTHVIQQCGFGHHDAVQRLPEGIHASNAVRSQLWDLVEVIPECPPRGQLLVSGVTENELDQELYGGKGVEISIADDGVFPVQYEKLLPDWKLRFKDCVAGEAEIPVEQQVCHADTEHVGETEITPGKVTAPKGIRLHTTPDPQDCDYVGRIGISAKVYKKGADILIIAKGNVNNTGWVKIQVDGDLYEGWIEERFISRTNKKDTTKDAVTLLTYTTQSGDMLEPLVKEVYKGYPYTTGNDRRTIVHAFSILNEGSKAIYFEGSTGSWKDFFDSDFAKSRDIYKTIKLYAGRQIRFPTVAYIDYLRAEGEVGVRPEWKNTAIAFARSIEGFLEGIVTGFFKAAWDTIKGLWDLIKGIITGELLNQAYELYKQIQEKGWSVIWNMIKSFAEGIINDFEAAWNNPNPYQKWKFFGEIVGMVVFEVVVVYFTAGAGAARHVGKVDKVLDALPALKKVMGKVGTKLDDVPAKGKIDVSKLGKVEKKIDDLGEMTGETRKMLRDPKHAPMLDSLSGNKKAAKALKKCASPCYKDFLSTRQIDEVEAVIRRAETHNVNIDYDQLKNYFHKAVDADDLDEKIDVLRSNLDRFVYDKSRGVSPFELDRLSKTEKLRNMPGRLSGGDHLPVVTKDNVATWYGEHPTGSVRPQVSEGNIMMPPKQVVDKLKAKFVDRDVTFRKLREEFWREMYNDEVINKFFSERGAVKSLEEMRNGRAPFALKDGRTGSGANAKLQLNHQQAIEHLGDRADEVLNFDNLEIVSPRFHDAMKQ